MGAQAAFRSPAPAPLLAALDGLGEAGAAYCVLISYDGGGGELISNLPHHDMLTAALRNAADQLDAQRRAMAN